MKRKLIFCLVAMCLSTVAFSKSVMDGYVGKWAIPEYGCSDEDGKGSVWLSSKNGKYMLDEYESHYTITKINRSPDNVVHFFAVSDGRHDGDESRKMRFSGVMQMGEQVYFAIDGLYDKPLMVFYCPRS